MISEKNNTQDKGSSKMNNEQKTNDKNEGFSGENLPNNYNPSNNKLNTELEKDTKGNINVEKRARSVDEKNAEPVTPSEKAVSNGEIVDKNRGTKNEDEAMETARNRDFNSDLDEDRFQKGHSENKKDRSDANPGS